MGTQRVLFTGSYYPPVSGGSAMTLARLVEQFPPDQTAVVCEHPRNFAGVHNALVPPCAFQEQVRASPWWGSFLLPAGVRRRARKRLQSKALVQVRRAVARFHPTHVVAVYPTQAMLEAARMAAMEHGLPCLPYFFDNPKPEETAAWTHESCLLALTEGVQMELQAQVQGEVRLVPHVAPPLPNLPVKEVARQTISQKLGIDLMRGPVIAHTGAVEALQLDGLKDLMASVQTWPGVKPQVILSSPSPEEAKYALREVEAQAYLCVLNLAPMEVAMLQRAADVLFATVPLIGSAVAFGKTCFPTKILDYLAVGTPIVVRGPEDSTLCRHARERGYAWTVTESGPRALQAALYGVLHHPEQQDCCLQQAKVALEAFSGAAVAGQLLSALEVARPVKA